MRYITNFIFLMISGTVPLIKTSRWDRYLGMTAAMTQVPVPTATDAFDTFTTSGFQRITDLLNEEK